MTVTVDGSQQSGRLRLHRIGRGLEHFASHSCPFFHLKAERVNSADPPFFFFLKLGYLVRLAKKLLNASLLVSQPLLQRYAAYLIEELQVFLLFPLGEQRRSLDVVNLLLSFVPPFCPSRQRSVIYQAHATQRSQAVLAGEASPAKLAFAAGIPVRVLGRSGSERLFAYFTVYHKICKAVLEARGFHPHFPMICFDLP